MSSPVISLASKRIRTVIYAGISFLAFLAIVYFFWIRPNEQLNNTKASLTAKEFIELKSNIRTGLAQALGGAALLIGLGFTWRSIRAAERNLTIAQENLAATQETAAKNIAIALEGQITDRFTKAIAQLGDAQLAVRLGGIYALERIAKDSRKDYWTIIEVLTAFVRERAQSQLDDSPHPVPATHKVAADIQAVINVLNRREFSYKNGEDKEIDLTRTDLRGGDFTRANLRGVNLARAHLEGALLCSVRLDDANLTDAHFDGAMLMGVKFSDTTRMKGATFKGALIIERDMEHAIGLTSDQRESMALVDLDSLLNLFHDDEPTKRTLTRSTSNA